MKKDYREKTVKGLITDSFRFKPVDVTVRMTSDRMGTTVSLQAANVMISIPIESVQDIIHISEK